MKILILGNGFIGKNLFETLNPLIPTVLTNKQMLDVTSKQSVKNFFSTNNDFSHIIYAIGLKDVNYCEKNIFESFSINAKGVKNILEIFQPRKFIYISTDYIFDGMKGSYKEDSIPNPNTVYGKTKLLGEHYTKKYSKNSLIVRTSGVYGKDCGWLQWLFKECEGEEKVLCFEDLYNSPTLASDLALMILDMIKIDYSGVVNLCGPESLNRFELYNIVLTKYNIDNRKLIKGTSTGIIPKNISLDFSLYSKLTGKIPMKAEEGFEILSRADT